MSIIVWFCLRYFPPSVAATVAAHFGGRPDLADDLTALCRRESRCSTVGVHERDSHISDREWRGQVNLGHLTPTCQPYAPRAWATRGAWGLSAGAHWRYLPPCYQASWLDYPLVSAWVALQKYQARCERGKRPGWCRVPARVRWNNRPGRAA